MACAAKLSTVQTLRSLPEEVSSYKNIEDTFPGIFEDGKALLADLAGKIQLMRLENEIFPNLKLEGGKTEIKEKELYYQEYSEKVAEYRQTLESVNGQIERAIELCAKVPSKDVRAFTFEDSTIKVYDYCQRILPTLHDWYIQGTLLDKRFMLIMTKDYKNYTESMSNFSATVNPSSSIFSGVASYVSSFVFRSAETPATELERKMAALTTGSEAAAAEATATEKKK